jgi:hypothetical protein
MRPRYPVRHALNISVAALLVGCGGSQPPIAAPGAMPSIRVNDMAHVRDTIRALYVDDNGDNGVVDIFKNGSWKKIGSISEGIGTTGPNWVDANGNLYVAQLSPTDVAEYAPGTTSPSFTYSQGMLEPFDVATDRGGNVYEADQGGGSVNEYPQDTNTISASCTIGAAVVESVAVDGSGDVFVGFLNSYTQQGQIMEYADGLAGCHGTTLGVTLGFPSGMAFDKKNNLVVCDEGNNSVDIVAPPYSAVSGTLGSGYRIPLSVRINRRNNQAYVADDGLPRAVFVFAYPAGSLIKKLGSKNGISQPTGAVDSENFNP